MKRLITFFLFFPLLLAAQNPEEEILGITCAESRALDIIYKSSIGNHFDAETLLLIEEFELYGDQGRELMMLLEVSDIPCVSVWNKKEYRKFLKEFGYPFSRKFDRKIDAYCECITENYSIFVWNVQGASTYGLLLTSSDPE